MHNLNTVRVQEGFRRKTVSCSQDPVLSHNGALAFTSLAKLLLWVGESKKGKECAHF